MPDQYQAFPANDSLLDPDVSLQRINDAYKARVLFPVTVCFAVTAFTGLVGNTIVLKYFYSFKGKSTPSSVFITTLAVYDIFSCAICGPTAVVDTVRFYTFTSGAACRILRFLSYFLSITSGLTIVTIAIHRYISIIKSSRKQMTVRCAKKCCIILAVVGAILSSPATVLLNAEKVPVPDNSGLNVTGHACTFVTYNSYQPCVMAFNLVLVIAFAAGVVALSVVYGITAWKIKRLEDLLDSVNEFFGISVVERQPAKFEYKTQTSTSGILSGNSCVQQQDGFSTATNTNYPKHNHWDRGVLQSRTQTSKIRMVGSKRIARPNFRVILHTVSVTILFALSFLPYTAVFTRHSVPGKLWGEISNSELFGYTIGTWSFLINSCFNPWQYCFNIRHFTQYYYNILRYRTHRLTTCKTPRAVVSDLELADCYILQDVA